MIDVFLADLRHNYGGVLSTDCQPLGIGFIKAVMDRELPADQVRSRLFCYPDKLLEAMESDPPDVLMVSNYVWNEALGHAFLRRLRRLSPNGIAIMGGPNLSIEADRQLAYMAEQPHVDVYILGEGEFVATEIVQRLLEARGSREEVLSQEVPSSVRRDASGDLHRSEVLPRRREVDEIPSPYLTGIMDEFFDGKLAPMIETNRGCPFRCTFCVQGTGFYGKVNYFDQSRIRDEIRYIARINHQRSPHMGTLRIADPNYGMYERDVEISSYIGEMQAQYGWPTFIDATTGKNKPERIIESMEKVNGALVLYQAVQSLDDEVLRNIDRSNIKLDAYEKLQVHVRGRGLRSTSDLILGLPGESLRSHLTGMHQLIDAGTHQAHCFQAMVLKGSDLEKLETRERFGFQTKFRVLPKNFGIYGDEKVLDIEEIVVATDTLPFEDYVTCRKHHFTFSIFWNDSWFADPVALVQNLGVRPSEWLTAMLEGMEADDGDVRRLLDDFVAETRGELFDTREACREFYSRDENFARLCEGEIGDNLMYKYRAKASFFDWRSVCAAGLSATRRLIEAHGRDHEGPSIPDLDTFWEDLATYVEAKHACGASAEEISAPVEVSLRYDFPAWAAAGHPVDPSPYRHDEPRRYRFELTDEGAQELRKALDVWTSKLTGLTKLVTRIRVESQVRTCRPVGRELALGGPASGVR